MTKPVDPIPKQHRAPQQVRRTRNRLWADRGPGKRPLWVLIGVPLAALGVIGVMAALAIYATFAKSLPSIDWARYYRPPIVSNLVSGDEQLIGEFYNERRKVVPYERVPKKLVQAFIASEDAAFFDHNGFSITGLLRASFNTFVLRRHAQGGSTITQQTAKAILASVEGVKAAHVRAGWAGKRRYLREFILARKLEANFSKEQILNLYLNEVYLGHHSYGVQAAAENYFRKNVWEMTLPEMSLIAGLPKAPSDYSPFSHPEKARNRRSYVLRRMLEEGMISQAEHDQADATPIQVYPVQDIFRETAPYVTEHVRRDLVARYGNERLLNDGLKIYTTVDLEREREATAATLRGIVEVDHRQGFRGPLTHLAGKEWPDFAAKEAAFLAGEGKGEEVVAALVTSIDKDGKALSISVGNVKGTIPLKLGDWARKPNPEVNAEFARILSFKGVVSPGDVVLVRAVAGEKGIYSLDQEPKLQGSLLSVDPNSGYVVAMIGGYDFEKSEFNRAFQACRQPGSAFKPIIYSAAIEQRGFTASTILLDAPIVQDDESNGKRWKPGNYEDEFKGDVPVRLALIHSMNTPAIRTLQQVGVRAASAWAHKLGITTKINEDLSMALGSSCVYLWDLTNVYTVFNRMGQRPKLMFLRRVLDRDGRILEDHSSFYDPWTELPDRLASGYARLFKAPEQVIAPETAFLIQQLMAEVCKYGTGAHAQALGKPVAGKTGTTNDLFDAWFMGYTRDLVTGVWVGYDTYETPMDKYETGGHTALPIWLDYMQHALKGVPQAEFDPPNENIVWVDIDGDTGRRAEPGTRQVVSEAYLKGTEPVDPNAPVTASGPLAPGEKAPPKQPQQSPDTADALRSGGL